MRTESFYCGDEVYSDGYHVSCDVLSEEPEPRFSGLYDANGNELWLTPEKKKIGFLDV